MPATKTNNDSTANSRKLRCPRSLVVSFSHAELVIYNYLKNTWMEEVGLDAFELLIRFRDWNTIDEVFAELTEWEFDNVQDGVTLLLERHLLLAEGDEYDLGLDGSWQHWQDDALFFHFWTRGDFLGSAHPTLKQAENGRWYQEASNLPWGAEIRPEKSPPPFKRYPAAPRIYLPRAFIPLLLPYQETLVARRTIRNFSTEPVGLLELSTLLHLTFGPMYIKDDGAFGLLQVRTSASGGSRHEAECYVGVLNVQGIPNGLYHYCGVEHSLELLQTVFTPKMAVESCTGQAWVADVGAIFYIAAVFERMSWKYRMSFAYRAILLNAGYLGQTFALTATALGLGAFQTGATNYAEIERWLGLNPFEESLMLTTACGNVTPEDRKALYVPVMGPTSIPLVRDFPPPTRIEPEEGS